MRSRLGPSAGSCEMSIDTLRQDLPPAVSNPRIHRSVVVRRARFDHSDVARRDSVHGPGELHVQYLAAEFGASDVAGAGATLGAVTQVGPIVTVLVVAGAGATAICADLGSRTIREEIDAMEVLGIDPIVRLVSPRVLASMLVAFLLNALVCAIGITGSFVFSVFFQNVTPGAFVDGVPLLTGLPELVISEVKAAAFGLIAALIACYKGLTVKGGPKSVGQAVNETVVYAFMALFLVNVVMTAIGIKMTAGR